MAEIVELKGSFSQQKRQREFTKSDDPDQQHVRLEAHAAQLAAFKQAVLQLAD